jgi:hypothetical protein
MLSICEGPQNWVKRTSNSEGIEGVKEYFEPLHRNFFDCQGIYITDFFGFVQNNYFLD